MNKSSTLRYRKKTKTKTVKTSQKKTKSPPSNYKAIQTLVNELLSHSTIKVQNIFKSNGLEIVTLKDIRSVAHTFNYTNEKFVLDCYKLINICIMLYVNGGMSWLEYFILIPQGRDEFRKMLKNTSEFAIFLSSFIFLPNQINSDWIFSAILKHIGLMTNVNFHTKYITTNFASSLIFSVQSILYRKGMSLALQKANIIKVYNSVETIKKYKKIVINSKLSREIKNELIGLLVKIITKKNNNPQVEISSFIHYIEAMKKKEMTYNNDLAMMAIKEGNKIIIYYKDAKLKQNGGNRKR